MPAWGILNVFLYPRGVQVLLLQPELSVPSTLLQVQRHRVPAP